MALTLEIDVYKNLETLERDISETARTNSQHTFDRGTPMKVELSNPDYKQLEQDLRAEGSYAGIRNNQEFMHNQWSISGVQVSFAIKKEDGSI